VELDPCVIILAGLLCRELFESDDDDFESFVAVFETTTGHSSFPPIVFSLFKPLVISDLLLPQMFRLAK